MKIIIDQAICDKYPSVTLGVVIVKNLNNLGNNEEIAKSLREVEAKVRQNYQTETLSQEPKINCWRKAYSAFGSKGGDYKSSVEALFRRVVKGNELRHINNLVDIYNLISLKQMLPVGGEDIDRIRGDLYLIFAQDNEVPVLCLGDEEPEAPYPGEVIYKDDKSTICRRWNWREADRTKLTETTKNAILVIEGLEPVARAEIEIATKELAEMIEKYCGGNTTYDILDKSKSIANIDL